MIAYPWGALVTGAMLGIAGILTLVRHFLLEPISPNYPKAPRLVRNAMFAFGTACIFLGLNFIVLFFDKTAAHTSPPQPSAALQFLAFMLVLYKSTLLVNILRQRYPEAVWDRLNRMNETLQCKNGTLLSQIWKRLTA